MRQRRGFVRGFIIILAFFIGSTLLFFFACEAEPPLAPNQWPQLCLQTAPQQLSLSFAVNPPDSSGISEVSPGECIVYHLGDSVTVTAPAAIAEYNFLRWQEGSNVIGSDPSISILVNQKRSLVAAYTATEECILAVESNGPAQISVSPADNRGASSGITPCSFVFNEGVVVTVTAAESVTRTWQTGGTVSAAFARWCPGNTTILSKSIVMDGNQNLRAVYPEVYSVTPATRSSTSTSCWMPLMLEAGDTEFGGNGPLVYFHLRVLVEENKTKLNAEAYAYAIEYFSTTKTYGDSRGEALKVWNILTLSDGSTIAGIKTYSCGYDCFRACYTKILYVDETTDGDDWFIYGGTSDGTSLENCFWIKKLGVVGDTGGADLSTEGDPCLGPSRTQIFYLEWNKVEYLKIPAPCD